MKIVGYENKFRVEMVVGDTLRSRTAHLLGATVFSLFKKNSSGKMFKMAIEYKFTILSLLFNHFLNKGKIYSSVGRIYSTGPILPSDGKIT